MKQVLGHSILAVTDQYLQRVFPEQAISAVRNRSGYGTPTVEDERVKAWTTPANSILSWITGRP